ncbi:hypothetical protein EJ110_NYTH02076 [Nymphaea thermarum]|nr:hypothetical protein EJ110_NYTH02076 [Nymphaea thermarum]
MEGRLHPDGLIVGSNDGLRDFLLSASEDIDSIPDERLRDKARVLSARDSVPYRSLREVYLAMPASSRPPLLPLLAGSDLLFASPKPREKCDELKERLMKLAELEERKAYDALIEDIAPKKDIEEPFSSYKDQLGFGLHVVVTMFTGYLVGYAAFRALFARNQFMSAAGGICGLVFAMLLETVLFIMRTSGPTKISSSSTSKVKKNL